MKGAGLGLPVGHGAHGAAGGTRLCRNTCTGKEPHARARIWEKNVGHGYETASGVWGPGYTEKDLAASSQPARCSFGGEDEQSRAGGHHAGGLPQTVLLPQGPRDRDWEIKKCSERKCSAMGGVEKLPPRAKNEALGLFSACERRCGGDLLSASAYLHGEKPDCTHLINFF